MADFEVIKEIGKGSYGTIFLVRSKNEIQQLRDKEGAMTT